MKAFNVEFDDEMDSIGESVVVLALDITEAIVISHEIQKELNSLLMEWKAGEIRIKCIEEMSEVVAPEYGFHIGTWIEKLKKAMEQENEEE